MNPQRWVAGVAFTLVLSASLQADILYLRDGSRVQGELIAVRNGTIEFEERRSFGSGRAPRFDRDEVVRIEFENVRRGGGNDFAGGGRECAQQAVGGDVVLQALEHVHPILRLEIADDVQRWLGLLDHAATPNSWTLEQADYPGDSVTGQFRLR